MGSVIVIGLLTALIVASIVSVHEQGKTAARATEHKAAVEREEQAYWDDMAREHHMREQAQREKEAAERKARADLAAQQERCARLEAQLNACETYMGAYQNPAELAEGANFLAKCGFRLARTEHAGNSFQSQWDSSSGWAHSGASPAPHASGYTSASSYSNQFSYTLLGFYEKERSFGHLRLVARDAGTMDVHLERKAVSA